MISICSNSTSLRDCKQSQESIISTIEPKTRYFETMGVRSGTAFSAYYFLSSPDVRVYGKSREELFRGDLKGTLVRSELNE
jgi:hypothetical protein